MKKIIAFDLDGTLVSLYNVPNWLEKLQAEDVTPYIEANPIYDMLALRAILNDLVKNCDFEIQVITWLAKDSTNEYKKATIKAKKDWLANYDLPIAKIHCLQYGTTKATALRNEEFEFAVLVDDNDKVRRGWHLGETINPTEMKLYEQLLGLRFVK